MDRQTIDVNINQMFFFPSDIECVFLKSINKKTINVSSQLAFDSILIIMKCIVIFFLCIYHISSALKVSPDTVLQCDFKRNTFFTCKDHDTLHRVFTHNNFNREVYIKDKEISRIMPDVFENLNITRLILELSPTILDLVPDSFNGLPALKDLHFKSGIVPLKPSIFRALRSTLTSLEIIIDTSFNATLQNALLGNGRLKNLTISHSNLSAITSGTFNYSNWQVLNLQLTKNKIFFIPKNTFQSMYTLKHLVIFSNELKVIESDSFNGLFQLEDLSITLNDLTSLVNGVFNGLSKLKILDLSNNQIEHIGILVFENLNISELYLSKNKLKILNHGYFNKLKMLKILGLAYNEILYIEAQTFAGLNLQELRLEKNKLDVIGSMMFSNLSTNQLYLSNDSGIMKIEKEAFLECKIETLYLYNFKTIDNFFLKLPILNIYLNKT